MKPSESVPAKVESPTSPDHNQQTGRESDTSIALKLAMACNTWEFGGSRSEQAKARTRAAKYVRELAKRFGIR